MSDDPRLGKVSASRLEILALCPGSEPLRQSLPPEALELQDADDEYAERGRRLHKAWETDNILKLDQEELDIFNKGIRTLETVRAKWGEELSIAGATERERELRLWLHDELLHPITSAQLDRLYVDGSSNHALVADFKGLWSPNLTPAERNWQGKLQAVVAAEELGVKHVRVVFIKAMFAAADQVDYNLNALAYARQSIYQAIWESEQPGAQRRPGRWCTHCPCKAYCDDAVAYAQIDSARLSTTNGDPIAIVNAMPVEDLVPVWRKRKLVEKIFDAITTRLEKLPADQLASLGLRLVQGRKNDKLKDVKAAFAALLAEGYSEDEVFGIMTIGKAAAVEMIQNSTLCGKKQAEEWWEKHMAEFIEPGFAKDSLKE